MCRRQGRFPNFATGHLSSQFFAYLVSDETVPDKTEVCNFSRARPTRLPSWVIPDGSSEPSCTARAHERWEGALDSMETAACCSHLHESSTEVIRDSSKVLFAVREKPGLHLELYQLMLQTKCCQLSVAT